MKDLIFGEKSIFYTHASTTILTCRSCKIDTNRYVVFYTTGTDGRIALYEHNGRNLNLILDQSVATDTFISAVIDCCKVDTNKWIIFYCGSYRTRVKLLYYNGSTITDYGLQLDDAGQIEYLAAVSMEPNKIMISYSPTSTYNSYVRCATCNDGTSLTWGSAVNIRPYTFVWNAMEYIDSGKVFHCGSTISEMRALICSVTPGLDNRIISSGSSYTLKALTNLAYCSCCFQDTNKVIASYGVYASSTGGSVACEISGNVISYGSVTNFTSNNILNTACARYIDENYFVVAYSDYGDSNKGKYAQGSINWGTKAITFDTSKTFEESTTIIYERRSLDLTHLNDYVVAFTYQRIGSYDGVALLGGEVLSPPDNIVITPDVEENNISWDSVLEADSYNLYWMLYEYFDELFSMDLSDWDIYKDGGTEQIYIDSGKLYCWDNTGSGWHVVRKTEIPSGNFEIQIDMVTYTPEDNSSGLYAYFRILDQYSPLLDRAEIYYYVSNFGSQHNIVSDFYVNGSLTNVTITISGVPSKFKYTRVGNLISVYYYITSWVLVQSIDFDLRASNLKTVVIDGLNNSGQGGIIEWDNILYWVDVILRGTKIVDVTSPYVHSLLTPDVNYIYVLTSENAGGESEETSIYNGVPLIGTPDPPSGISTEGGEGQNTITFIVNPEADETHIYWSNSPGVSPETGNKIADVLSPYIHDDLNPSLTYYYVLTSENEYGEGEASAEYSDSPYPESPENVATEEGIEKIILTWDDSLGADSYNLYWRNEAGVTKVNSTKITGVTSPYSHSGLTPGLDYFYALAAEDEDGESSLSSEVSGVPNLAAPGSPEADLSGALEITVTWNPVVGAIRYNLYWDKSPGVTVETGNKIVDVTSPYIHTDLDDGDTYYYIITAENAVEEGIPSVEVSAVVGDAPIPPANVAAVSTDIQEITVSWSSVSGAESYNIYYGVFNGINKIVGTKIEDVISPYVFDAPIPDIQYYFLVTAVDDITGESDESEVVNALSIPPIPDAPTDVVATPGEAKIILDFTVAPYADTHHIYWSTTPGVTQLTGTKIADVSTGYEFIVPELYISYYFIITAENESGESVDSVEVNAIPIPVIPNIPENVEGEPTASGELTISWDVALYAETYNVYYSRLPNVDKVSASKIEGFGDVEAILSELIAGRFYYFAVSAVNPEGESELSEEAFARVINSLSGQQIFYIKAESEKNGVIVSWSELEYADSYNLYWSKNTPVDTATANKIENVSSPYRHYRLSTDDPYYVVTGENILGESDPSSEANADPDATDFQSINFLPENLHEYPLFQEFCNIVDYVVAKYHYENVDKLTGLYDAVHSDFDPNYVLKLLGSDYFLQFDLNDDQKKALCLLLSNLYDMKGTKKGLDYVLRLMGLDAQVYEWYNINQGLYPEIPEIVDPCSIVIDLGLGDHSLSDETEQQFLNLASYLLWVCVKLHGIFWSKKFEDWFEGIEDELVTIEIDNSIYDKFCSYMYNYPETVIIGSPVMGSITFVGESGLTIGATYFEGYPFLISPDLEGGADTDGVCQPHFIGEPDIYIGGGDISQLSWIIEED